MLVAKDVVIFVERHGFWPLLYSYVVANHQYLAEIEVEYGMPEDKIDGDYDDVRYASLMMGRR